jgi:hypothetical protein
VTETFVAEILVDDRNPDFEEQLASSARAWFGGPVRLVAVEVSLSEADGVVRYLVRGRFQAASPAEPSQLRSVVRWLGLVQDSSDGPQRPG